MTEAEWQSWHPDTAGSGKNCVFNLTQAVASHVCEPAGQGQGHSLKN